MARCVSNANFLHSSRNSPLMCRFHAILFISTYSKFSQFFNGTLEVPLTPRKREKNGTKYERLSVEGDTHIYPTDCVNGGRYVYLLHRLSADGDAHIYPTNCQWRKIHIFSILKSSIHSPPIFPPNLGLHPYLQPHRIAVFLSLPLVHSKSLYLFLKIGKECKNYGRMQQSSKSDFSLLKSSLYSCPFYNFFFKSYISFSFI